MAPVARKRVEPSKPQKSTKEAESQVVTNSEKRDRGVLFIKNISHGFLERTLRTFFQKFGSVTRVRLALKTGARKHGRSKGHAFIEFEVPQVAKIASDTVNDVKFKEMLKATYIGPEEEKANHFRGDKLQKQKEKYGSDLSSNSSSDEEDYNTTSSDTSHDGEEINSGKRRDGKALLHKLVNETFDENDSTDEDFDIDVHSFSGYDDESTDSVGLPASKSKAKKQSASNKKSMACEMTDSSVSESEDVDKHKYLKKAIHPRVSKKLATYATSELQTGGKRKRETNSKMKMKVSTSRSWVSSSEGEADNKYKRSKSKRVKTIPSTSESDGEVIMPLVINKKSKLYSKLKAAKSKINFQSEEDEKEEQKKATKKWKELKKPKVLQIKKGKSGIAKKMKKGPKKSFQKKRVKKTPVELYTLSDLLSNRKQFTK